MIRKVLAWAQRNERHLGAFVFLFGFITDVIALVLLDVSFVLAASGIYLALAAIAVFLTHALSGWRSDPSIRKRSAAVILPLIAQYLIGNLLSWFLIFYTKSAALEASWPFLLLFLFVFIGNEWFRKYKDRIAFIAVLLFFAAYAYAIFALPLFLRTLGPWVFLASTAFALAAFGIYLALLGRVAKLGRTLAPIIASCLAIVALVIGAYFTGLVPPIPLALKDSGVFHSLVREGDRYVVTAEAGRQWWDPRPDTVHVAAGSPLYAFSAVQAPIRFGATVVHRWQRYDETSREWVTQSRVAFPIAGGRAEGYRGYSEVSSVVPGEWRVRVETENGQVIGQVRFTAVRSYAPIELHEETY